MKQATYRDNSLPATDRPRVDKLTIVHETDPHANFDNELGKYSDKPGPDDRTIDRKERGDMCDREYRYFIAAMSGEETGNPESVEQDYQRMEAYNRQEWYSFGVYVVAEVSYSIGQGSRRIERFQSGGLWGIESDSEPEYIEKVEQEQLDDLLEHLTRFGVEWNDKAPVQHATR